MAIEDKSISYRIYLFAIVVVIFVIAIVVKLTNIQWVEGDYYRKLAKERSVKNFVIPANKGNIYSSDGSLLATSIPNYRIRFDALAPSDANFNSNINALADSLSVLLGKPSNQYRTSLTRARTLKNRYFLVARDLSYTNYIRIKNFPLFKLGAYKGGIIVEQETVREHPIGKIAERTIGYERVDHNGNTRIAGIEGAFSDYLNGKDGKILKQRIAKGQWKPLRDNNEIEPQDGYDIVSTIDVYIQDIAHHALLKQLEYYEADHGSVVVMECNTGEVKAIANLGREANGTYYEKLNYAIGESQEPGSTFKLIDLIALLDDKKADTSTVYDTNGGVVEYYRRKVRDSHKGGYGKISLARGFEVSSNTVMAQAIHNSYKDNPSQFIDRINSYGFNKPLGLPIEGEGIPIIPQVKGKSWSGLTLPWMAYGYGVSVTPMQMLTLYNAVANDGIMVKPIFVKEVKEWNKTIKKFNTEIINPKICSDEALAKVRAVLENTVKNGTGKKLYSKDFSMAGKTGTAQVNYGKGKGVESGMYYASSFAGYFPADQPKYSCIIIIHRPSKSKGIYGADVAGPVFKRIAQKIFTDSPTTNEVKNLKKKDVKQEASYDSYYTSMQKKQDVVPNVKGMTGMDAVALLGNMGLRVKIIGVGKVKNQSLLPGNKIDKNALITLELS
ncbi:penicillin-binding protein [Flavobacterium antarcticum]|uniref:penicillin-binding protein n=1 Tax=Flavobacterium antarcticum TaxID=271155 RepID=UPI0003B5510B|nr:penicillin-binding protein [Flavobacterium antarcticum]